MQTPFLSLHDFHNKKEPPARERRESSRPRRKRRSVREEGKVYKRGQRWKRRRWRMMSWSWIGNNKDRGFWQRTEYTAGWLIISLFFVKKGGGGATTKKEEGRAKSQSTLRSTNFFVTDQARTCTPRDKERVKKKARLAAWEAAR